MSSQCQNSFDIYATISSKITFLRKIIYKIPSLWQPTLPSSFDAWWSYLSPEFHLMLACLRLNPNDLEIRRITDLSRDQIEWPSFLNLLDRHRTAPLVYRNLRRFGTNIPASFMELLQSRFENNARRGLTNAAELVRLYKLFQKNQIPVLPLKGSVLATQLYGNLALRHAGDIDLLVAPQHVELADQLLQTSYRRFNPSACLTPAQYRRFSRVMNNFQYLHCQENLILELHWQPLYILSPAALDFSRLIGRTSEVTIAGLPLPALSLEENILYLCAHGGNHFWFRLFWLVDLAEIIRQNHRIDWRLLLNLAAEAGLLTQLIAGVVLAHKILGAPLPKEVQNQTCNDSLVSYQAQVSCRYMICPNPEDRPLALRLHLFACRFRVAHSLPEKLNILQEFFLGIDWLTMGLPDFLFFLYYVMRLPFWLQRRLRRGQNQTG